jgi:hypothetical protein
MLCLPPSLLQALREAIAALYDNLKPEQLVVCVPEEGALQGIGLRVQESLTISFKFKA